ncbi:MAG: DNA/RNA nuclease SfsA [Treponema sp.]|jgi:sugar fermentation stimulation protein A|nr:DNA/RNA nuclease SfsA [Treponema sp.]
MKTGTLELFSNDLEAVFIRRPNRFLIIAGAEGREIACHCPNPGRLIEFVFPGMPLILEKRAAGDKAGTTKPAPKTGYTAAGIRYRDAVVPLFASRANKAAEKLILDKIIPGLKEIHREYSLGNSRFDFLCIDDRGKRHLVEVKACSLVEYGVAMFPDAPSDRALKHLEELAELSRQGYCCHVLFVVVHGSPEQFIPNLHTDPAFAAALSRLCSPAGLGPVGLGPVGLGSIELGSIELGPVGLGSIGLGPVGLGSIELGSIEPEVAVHAALFHCNAQGIASLVRSDLPVDLSHGALAESDGGNYLLVLELPKAQQVEVGALGSIGFKQGWYVYTGSARKNLARRLARHLRKLRKQKHWHIDYLTPFTGRMKALPIMSYRNLECELARELAALGGAPVAGFGCSDCGCFSHLYYFPEPPLGNRAFVDMLLRYRHRVFQDR